MPTADRYHQYQVLRHEDGRLWELGRGAMGITFKAFDTNLRFPVALKIINAAFLENETARQRFLREARAAAALRHPNVASVFNLGTENDTYYYVMEYIDGETVEARVKRQGPLDPLEALNIGLQVTQALTVAAKQQLVHRDLKPSNLMITGHEGETLIKVIDFGLAKVARDTTEDSSALTVGGFVGTPHFASPEQIEEGEVDIRSDIYSLGVTLYFVLTGQSPFSGSLGQVMSQQLYKPLPLAPLGHLPQCVVSLLQRMMEKDRNRRPQTPQELQKSILACLEDIRNSTFQSPHAASAYETIELTSASEQPPGVGAVVAQKYKLIKELSETPQGRNFLAEDLLQTRQVTVLLLSAAFASERMRITALEEAVRLVRSSPHPMLRQIFALETVTSCTFLVQEHLGGACMLDILRARSQLTAQEVVRLINLLAPLVDHATNHRLRHVDLTLSGIRLTSRDWTKTGLQPDLLLRPLTAHDPLEANVDAINFSFSVDPGDAWSSPATRIQRAPMQESPGSCLRLLGLLGYELLGGPRARLETTGQYTPVSALTLEGNAVLRRAVIDGYPSAEEFATALAAVVAPTASVPNAADQRKREAQSPDIPGSSPQGPVDRPDHRQRPLLRRRSILALWLAVCVVVLLAIGFYTAKIITGTQEISVLSIHTDPADASILLDGKPPDALPNTFYHVRLGIHRLTATLNGNEVVNQDVEVRKGMPPELLLNLNPIQELPALSIETEPAGASILLDGAPPQKPPNTFTHVRFGSHQVTASLDGYEPVKQEIQVSKGMPARLNLPLKPIQELPALSIETEPTGASILLDGAPPQQPPNTFTHVRFGSHQVTASLEGYEPVKQEIQVSKGMPARLNLSLKPIQELPALSIETEPTGASILLDGAPPQRPPNTFTHVTFGSHELIATLDKYEPAKQIIDVRRGMAPELQLKLKQNPPDEINWILGLDRGKLEEARQEYAATLEIYHDLAQKNPEAYRPEVAKTVNNLAILDSRRGHLDEARQEFAQALETYRDLMEKNQELYRPYVATAVNNLANVDLEQGRLEDARKGFVEALQIRRELAQKNPEIYRPFVAKTLNNLAILDRRQGRTEEARTEFSEALQTYRELPQTNPETYQPFVATILNNLGNINLDEGQLEQARKAFAESLEIRRALSLKNPDLYRPYAVTTLNNLAIVDTRLGRLEDARKEFAEVLDSYRELAQKNPETFRPFVAATIANLGDFDLDHGRKEDARREYAEALQIYETLEKQDPAQYTPQATRIRKQLNELPRKAVNPAKTGADQ